MWKNERRGGSGYFKGKEMIQLGDERKILVPMQTSRAMWNPDTRVLELFVNMYEPYPMNEVYARRRIKADFKERFHPENSLCVVENGRRHKGVYQSTVQYYGRLPERPKEEDILNIRDYIRKAAGEPMLMGYKKDGTEVYYTYSELPYDYIYRSKIMLEAFRVKNGEKPKTVGGYKWKFDEE